MKAIVVRWSSGRVLTRLQIVGIYLLLTTVGYLYIDALSNKLINAAWVLAERV